MTKRKVPRDSSEFRGSNAIITGFFFFGWQPGSRQELPVWLG